mmetsp:Transcript_54920/g.133375  ORF Transcript_54920/g.133375 Transcript_54920/m.133375 type:complete len:681 (-) Transcript_54920:86-2128(-)
MNHLNSANDSSCHSQNDRSLLRVVLARQHGLCLQTSFAQLVARRIWGARDGNNNKNNSTDGGRGSGSGRKELLMTGSASLPSSTNDDQHSNHLEIVSPHTRSINCLDIDKRENRFLLVGSSDATVSIYDISPWGNNERSSNTIRDTNNNNDVTNTRNSNADTTYHPIAQSIRQSPRSSIGNDGGGEDDDPFAFVPSGHTSRISYAQWYPTDAGIFLTASATSSSSGGGGGSGSGSGGDGGGEMLLWDAAQMKPVLNVQPFRSDLSLLEGINAGGGHQQTSGPITADVRGGNSSSDTSNGSSSSLSSSVSATPMLATAAWNLSPIKLVDLNSPSGPAAFTLTGHVGGVAAIQWSPTNSNVLVSGGHDSTIRLWDIRKSGSRAMITTLNRERVVTSSTSTSTFSSSFSPANEGENSILKSSGPNFKSDYSHLREFAEEQRHSSMKRRRRQQHDKLMKKRQRQTATTPTEQQQKRLVGGYLDSPQGSSLPSSSMHDNPSNYDAVESAATKIAHSGHVAGLKFTNDGRYLVSVGALDGELLVWDLVMGARLPTKFILPGGSGQATEPHQRGRVPICIEDLKYDKNWDSTIWIPRGSKILGFNLMDGGCPTQTLCGSLSNIESLGMNRFDKTLFSGSQDGMVLAWGSSSPYNTNSSMISQHRHLRRRRNPTNNAAREDGEDEDSW